MPKADWGVSSRTIDEWDRSNQYTPYDGPVPRDVVYAWHIKVFKYIAATGKKYPQLRVGLELFPRRRADEPYAGYFMMLYLSIAPTNQFTYVPLLDALGITGSAFENSTQVDADGNITRIGKWRNDGEQYICGKVAPRKDSDDPADKELSWIGPYKDAYDPDDEDTDDSSDEYEYDDDESDDDEEDEPF